MEGQITDVQSSILQQADLIASKVSKTEFDALGQRVSAAETSITQTANQIKLLATKAELNALGDRVTAAEASIELTSESIKLMVKKTEFDALSQRVLEAETAIRQTSEEIDLKASKTELDNLGNIVSSNTASINIQADKITSLVSETNALGTKYTEVKQTADGLTTTVQGLNGDISRVENTANSISSTVSNLNGEVSNVKQTAQGLSVSITNLQGNYTQLQAEVDSLWSAVGDGEISVEDFRDALKDINDKVTANINAINKAQDTADAANGLATSHVTLIEQNAKAIQLQAARVQTDSSGNITNINTSALVLKADYASLFSTQVNEQGIAKTAQLSTYVTKNDLGNPYSGIDISADLINLTGKVTFSDLNSSAQSTINGKLSSSDFNTFKGTLGDLAYADMVGKAKLDSTVIEGGYIKTSLINANDLVIGSSQVDGLGALALKDGLTPADLGLSSWVSENTLMDALEGETIITGGYIDTKLINADEIIVKKFKADNNGCTYSIDSSGFKIKDGESTICELHASDFMSNLKFMDSDYFMSLHSYSIAFSKGSNSASLGYGGLNLESGSSIKGLAVGNVGSSLNYATDFHVSSSGTSTLPSASSCPGKVIFVKKKSGTLKVNNVYLAGGSSIQSSYSWSDTKARIFISDGSSWYEFYSGS